MLNAGRYFSVIPLQAVAKVLDIIVSGLSSETELVAQDIESDEQEAIKSHREILEIYCFLLQWAVAGLENHAADKTGTVATTAPRRKGKLKGRTDVKSSWDSISPLTLALEAMCKVMKLKLLRVFVTTSERDTFISLFTRPVYLLMESEQRVKNTAIRMHIFKVLCMAVKHHGHAFGNSYHRSCLVDIDINHFRCSNIYCPESYLL